MTTHPQTEADRVRRYTSPEQLREIDQSLEEHIRFYATQPPEAIDSRIEELRNEWSMERYLQVNAASVGLTTTVFGLFGSRKWLVLTCGALGFFMYHALRGFEPPVVLLRRMGVRTRREIDREIYALKVVRGDFKEIPDADAGADVQTRAEKAIAALAA